MKKTGFLVIIILAVFPLIDRLVHFNIAGDLPPIFIFGLLALGLNIIVGFTGLLNIGTAAFFAIGVYAAGILTSPLYPFQIGFWKAFLIVPVITALAGLVLGSPTLRLKGDYLAIVTLGFGEMIQVVLKNLEPITMGTKGINPVPVPHLFGKEFFSEEIFFWYYFTLIILGGCTFICRNLERSWLGQAWVAVREDELAALCMGINTTRYKLLAFAIGAFFSGLAGVLYASYLQSTAEPGNYDFAVSIMILCMVLIGGIGNIYGVLLGTGLLMVFDRIIAPLLTKELSALLGGPENILLNFNNWRWLIFGLVLVLMMRWRPEGLLPSRRFKAELHR
ncbi:MAG: branched-chain amino acid ABC transporter permease [Planctomycetota bacterium]